MIPEISKEQAFELFRLKVRRKNNSISTQLYVYRLLTNYYKSHASIVLNKDNNLKLIEKL